MKNFNTYPIFNEENFNTTLNNDTKLLSKNNLVSKLLPLLISGKQIEDILPLIAPSLANNPLALNILKTQSTNTKNTNKKIESDKIDLSTLYKVN